MEPWGSWFQVSGRCPGPPWSFIGRTQASQAVGEKQNQVSLFRLSQEKIEPLNLASATATFSGGAAASLGSAGAWKTCSRNWNPVAMSILSLEQQNAKQKYFRKEENDSSKWEHLALATATPSCGTAAMLWCAGACKTCSRNLIKVLIIVVFMSESVKGME